MEALESGVCDLRRLGSCSVLSAHAFELFGRVPPGPAPTMLTARATALIEIEIIRVRPNRSE